MIDDRIYEYFMSLLPPAAMYAPQCHTRCKIDQSSSGSEGLNVTGPPPESHVTRFWKTGNSGKEEQNGVNMANFQSATLLESRTTVEGGTTGLRTWLASQVLAQYLILHQGKIPSYYCLMVI
jgi:protein-lysine N-methyltransferase EEF2KMT